MMRIVLDFLDESANLNCSPPHHRDLGLNTSGVLPGGGVAFGPEGEGWLRWCFASKDASRLGQGVDRLSHWLSAQA